MKSGEFPLFKDFNTYEKWLPVRQIDTHRKLYQLPHYTNENDLDLLVKKLEERTIPRRDAKYFVAPPASGKTCAVLPAFLRSAAKDGDNGFTHYIYIAFRNNKNRSFRATPFTPDNDKNVAYKQGAAFIINCLEKILHDQEPIDGEIDINEKDSGGKAIKYMEELISKLSKGGKKTRILFHVDEHRDMCERTGKKRDTGADFSRGVMSTLVMADPEKECDESLPIPITVIATYTDIPDLPYKSTSGVCRSPLGLPPIDIERVMKVTKVKDKKGNYYYPFQFPFDKKDLEHRDEKRLFATLKFKLAMKISIEGRQNLHYPDPNSDYLNLCEQFNLITFGSLELKEKLIACSNLCNFTVKEDLQTSTYATELLLGIPEERYDALTKKRLKRENLLMYGALWTAPLETLLFLREASKDLQNVYKNPKASMKDIVNGADLMSHTPLEVAYRWTLYERDD